MLGEKSEDYDLIHPIHRKSTVVILCRGRQRGFAIKLYKRFEKYLNAKKTNEVFTRYGIPCPRMLYSRIFPGLRAGLRMFLIVQEEIRGPYLEKLEDRDETIIQMGKALATMHRCTRNRWGAVCMPSPRNFLLKHRSYLSYRLNLTMGRLDNLEGWGGVTGAEAKRLATMLEETSSRIQRNNRYELIHFDLNPTNVIVRDKMPYMVDLESARFGHLAHDLERARHRLCASDLEQQLFLDSYFAEAGHVYQDLYDETKPFYELDYHVDFTNHYLKRYRNKDEEQEESYYLQEYQFHRDQLLSLIG